MTKTCSKLRWRILLGLFLFAGPPAALAQQADNAPAPLDRLLDGQQQLGELLAQVVEGQKRLEQQVGALEQQIGTLERQVGALEQRLVRLEEGQRGLEQQLVESVTALGQRIDDTNQRVSKLREFMLWGFSVTLAGMFALIGFVIWDRRSALAPAVRRLQDLEEREQRLEAALREYAATSPQLADSLRKMGLL